LALLWAHGEMQTLIERAIDYGSAALARNREKIKLKVSQHSYRLIPKWIDAIIADKIVAGLTQVFDEMREPYDPWRVDLADAVERLIKELATDPQMHERGEDLKARMLENPVVAGQIPSSPVPVTLTYDVGFSTGLTLVTATAAGDVTVSYK
jgi:uncharacterized membrane-anchored protein YjiN (DUF445 family)